VTFDNPDSGIEVRPAYARILSDLSAIEVGILDFLARDEHALHDGPGAIHALPMDKIEETFALTREDYQFFYDDLSRHGLLLPSGGGTHVHGNRGVLTSVLTSSPHAMMLSQLGKMFIRACSE
jgi:hypothetical protein